jgi:hypothetical protein
MKVKQVKNFLMLMIGSWVGEQIVPGENKQSPIPPTNRPWNFLLLLITGQSRVRALGAGLRHVRAGA